MSPSHSTRDPGAEKDMLPPPGARMGSTLEMLVSPVSDALSGTPS
jgi:hypothetical protein